MASCPICSKALTFLNTPVLGQGYTSEGDRLCSECYLKIPFNTRVTGTEKFTAAQLKTLLTNDTAGASRIEKQLADIGMSSAALSWGKSEIAELPEILEDDEVIFACVAGIYNSNKGILVATNRRLIFVDKGMLYGLQVREFSLGRISSIEYQTGILLADISIHCGGTNQIKDIPNKSARKFCEDVRARLMKGGTSYNGTATKKTTNVADEIGKLAALKEQGILTQDEFNAQKKKLLGL